MVNARLQIGITVGPEPDPNNPILAVIRLRVDTSWSVNGALQDTRPTDRAAIIAAIKQALDLMVQGVPFEPPSVIAAPLEVIPGSH